MDSIIEVQSFTLDELFDEDGFPILHLDDVNNKHDDWNMYSPIYLDDM